MNKEILLTQSHAIPLNKSMENNGDDQEFSRGKDETDQYDQFTEQDALGNRDKSKQGKAKRRGKEGDLSSGKANESKIEKLKQEELEDLGDELEARAKELKLIAAWYGEKDPTTMSADEREAIEVMISQGIFPEGYDEDKGMFDPENQSLSGGPRGVESATVENPVDAVWRNKDNDLPVRVTGSLGVGPDGVEYLSVEGSTSGIPRNEVEITTSDNDENDSSVVDQPEDDTPVLETNGDDKQPPKEPPVETAQSPENPERPSLSEFVDRMERVFEEIDKDSEESVAQLRRVFSQEDINRFGPEALWDKILELAKAETARIAQGEGNVNNLVDQDPATQTDGGGDGKGPPNNVDVPSPAEEPDPENNNDESPAEKGNALYREVFAKWKAIKATDAQAEKYARLDFEPLIGGTLEESIEVIEEILRDKEIQLLPEKAFDWLDGLGISDDSVKGFLDKIKENYDKGMNVDESIIQLAINSIDKAVSGGRMARNDSDVKMARAQLQSLLSYMEEQREAGLTPEEKAKREEARRRARERGESVYDLPASIEDLIFENSKYAPLEYRMGHEKALLYFSLDEDGKEKLDEKGNKAFRVNFENFTRYIHDLAITRGAVSPRSAVNYFSVLKFRKGYNSFTLEDLLLYDETATLFLPSKERGETDAQYSARVEAYREVRDNLSADLWIRQNDREKHMLLEYSGARGSDEKHEGDILKAYNDNVPIRSLDFQTRLNLSNALSFSPEAMNKRIALLVAKNSKSKEDRMQDMQALIRAGVISENDFNTTFGSYRKALDEAVGEEAKEKARENMDKASREYIERVLRLLDDNYDGQIFRQGLSAYAHLGDIKALLDIFGEDSAFFKKKSKEALPEVARGFVKDLKGAMEYLEDQQFNAGWFEKDENGNDKLKTNRATAGNARARFINTINIFNSATKPIFTMEAVQERMVIALAEKAYKKFSDKYRETLLSRIIEKNEKDREKHEKDSSIKVLTEEEIGVELERELWKTAFDTARYNHEDSHYWTSFGGLNTQDNDPGAAAFRAKSKIDNFWQYMKKQYRDRGQLAGNIHIGSGVTRMSTAMVNAIRTLDDRSILDVVEGRKWKGGDTARFDFDDKVENVSFRQDAMSFLADNHYRRVFKWFRETIDSKELSFGSFIERDKSPFGNGRFILNKDKAEKFFGALKDWRYIFNEVPMDQKIRVIVGEDENGEYIYEEKYMAEAFFTKELLNDYVAHEDIWRGVLTNYNYEVEEDVRARNYHEIVEEDEYDEETGKLKHKKGDVLTHESITPVDILGEDGEVKYKAGSRVPEGTVIHKKGDRIEAGKKVYMLDVKKGELDHDRFGDGWVWKSFTKYYIMAEILNHRNKNNPTEYYDGKILDEIFEFLEILPMEADWGNPKNNWNDRKAGDAYIKKFFFSEEELDWIKDISNSKDFWVNLEELKYTGGAGLLAGLIKALLVTSGAEKALSGK